MNIEGGCHCGQLEYTAEINEGQIIICHCDDCQTLSGAAYRTVAIVADNPFKLTKGELKTYIKTAESGNLRAQTFCPECGTPIYAGPVEAGTSYYGIRVGSIKQRDQLVPKKQIWCRSEQPWTQNISDVPRNDIT